MSDPRDPRATLIDPARARGTNDLVGCADLLPELNRAHTIVRARLQNVRILLLALLCSCAGVRPASVTVEGAVGHACYGRECGPNTEARVSVTWDVPR